MPKEFEDFDEPANFHKYVKRAKDADARNFVLEFSHDKARCAFDIDETDLKTVLENERPTNYNTRWINLWGPNRQPKIVDRLAATYGFSPRLTGLMRSQPSLRRGLRKRCHAKLIDEDDTPASSRTTDTVEMIDLEKTVQGAKTDSTEADLMRELNHYDVVSTIYHWSSVDIGVKHFCLGCNWLHNVKPDRADNREEPDLPQGERIWSWLILCDDKTVISMYEDPFAALEPHMRAQQDATKLRRNLLNVFVQLSRVSRPSTRNPISLVPIRHVEETLPDSDHGPGQPVDANANIDGPGCLFYYLFDDWYATYALLAKEEHHYGKELKKLRDEMIQSPRLKHINSLQHIGRQLACLKRLYQSYELVINRVLEKQRTPIALNLPPDTPHPHYTASHHTSEPASTNTGIVISNAQAHSNSTPAAAPPLPRHDSAPMSSTPGTLHPSNVSLYSRPVCIRSPPLDLSSWPTQYQESARRQFDASYDQFGVYLTSAARVRFERLRDRVRLYAISEISECIDLTNSLTTMNYNLIAFQETTSMERLTRVTTLLSKATILFLPVSLLSAYFGIEWDQGEGETVTSYWVAFAVIFTVTFIALLIFGVMSKTIEGAVVYQPIWRAGIEVGRRVGNAGRGVMRH